MLYPGFFPVKSEEDSFLFTKDAYNTCVKKNRREYIHKYFFGPLQTLFNQLRIDSSEMKTCHREVVFEIPEKFDVNKTTSALCLYFSDIGYKPLVESLVDNKLTITIT